MNEIIEIEINSDDISHIPADVIAAGDRGIAQARAALGLAPAAISSIPSVPTRMTSERIANARLIAAAPDMYDALERLVFCLDTMLSPRSPLSRGVTPDIIRGFLGDDLDAARKILTGTNKNEGNEL